jgi:hypothetical protein
LLTPTADSPFTWEHDFEHVIDYRRFVVNLIDNGAVSSTFDKFDYAISCLFLQFKIGEEIVNTDG